MPPVDDLALTRRRQHQLATIRTTVGVQLGRRWMALPAYTDDQHSRWAATARPVVVAGQTRAASMQTAYLQRLLGQSLRVSTAAVLAAAAVDLSEPFAALAGALASGDDIDAAIESAAARAAGLGESAVQWASRAASAQADDGRIVGWTRTLGAGSCEWCQQAAEQTYRTAESASFGHQRCSCSVDPIIGDRDPGRMLNSEFIPDQ